MNNNPTSATRPLYIGYILKRYPRFSETFVVDEILAHEREGMKIDIFALGPVEDTHFQDGISGIRALVTCLEHKHYKPETAWLLIQMAFERLPSFAKKLARAKCAVYELTQSISVALEIQDCGIQHLHAHFGTQAATVARLTADSAGVTYTSTAHAKDIYFRYAEPTRLDMKTRDTFATVTVSGHNLACLQQQYDGDVEKAARIYNGMDLSKFPYNEFASRERHILAVGRLVSKKEFGILLEALSLLKKQNIRVHCTLVGGGPLYEDLSARTEALDIADIVTMVGPIPQPNTIRLMKNSNMVVASCATSDDGDRDGLPTVLLESMALGTPVIPTQVAGIPELVIDGKTGFCVPSENPQASAEAVARLLDDHDICRTLSRNSHVLIEREYDGDRNAAKLRQIFNDAIDSRPTV